jgi:hypothetical protein
LGQTGLGHVIRISIITQIRASNFDLANQARWFSFGWGAIFAHFKRSFLAAFCTSFQAPASGSRSKSGDYPLFEDFELCSRSESALRLWFHNLPH